MLNQVAGLFPKHTIPTFSHAVARTAGALPSRNGLIVGGVVAVGVYTVLSPLELFGYLGFGMGKGVRALRIGIAGIAGIVGAKEYHRAVKTLADFSNGWKKLV